MRRLLGVLTVFGLVLGLVVAACASDDVADPGVPAGTTSSTVDTGSSLEATTSTVGSSSTDTDPTAGTGDATQFVDIYFVQGNGYATAVATPVETSPGIARSAVLALIAGPTAAQQEAGLGSSVPGDTELLGLTIEDGLAQVDFSSEFEAGGGTFSMTARLAQVVYTLTAFSNVDAVEFWLEGEPVTVFSGEGLVLDGPVERVDVLAGLPLTPTVLNSVELWEQADLPDIDRFREIRRVVLIPERDVLNVRLAAGAGNEIIGMLATGTEVALTGPIVEVGSSGWYELVTPAGAGWVNGRFLAEPVDDPAFRSDERVTALLDRTVEIIKARGDLGEVASVRGLYVSHHAPPVRFTPAQLATVLGDGTTYKWPSNTIDMDDPVAVEQEVPSKTFAEAIGDSLVSTWDDPDRATAIDEPLNGGNGRLPSFAIPPELVGFHFISIFDSGDNPDFGGLDWTSWHVSIDYEDGEPVLVGLTIDQWSP
ncbi:MAG: GerMN domain-containing protein [Acidimicrobiales bacterium]